MTLYATITLFSSWIFLPKPELTGIKISGDTCEISSPITFELVGSSNSSYFTWDFGDPASGAENRITIDGSRGSSFPSHKFSSPGEYEVHVWFQEPGLPEARLCKEITIGECCPGSNSSITNVSVCKTDLPYIWNGNSYSSPGNYKLTFTNALGCDSIATLILQLALTQPELGNDTTLCPGEKLLLNPGNYTSYTWQDMSTNPSLEVTQPGQYSVTVQNEIGCSATDLIDVRYEKNCGDIYFPSAITPNNDGKNDAFSALGNVSSVSNYRLTIYNRFGQVVYSSSDPFQHWDGQLNSYTLANNNFVWNAAYLLNGRSQKYKKGILVVIK